MERLKKRLIALYDFRFLIKQLVGRDIKLKYRRSFLGYVWSVLNPLMTMIVMTIVFSRMFPNNIQNYSSYLIIGQVMFGFVTEATNQALTSITGNAALIKKVYVPKYVFTLSKITSSMVNLLFSLGAMLIVFIVTRVHFNVCMFMIPVILLETYVFCLGLGLFLAQASVFFRDIQYIYNVITTIWMYLTPIFYPIESLPETVQYGIKTFNPMFNYINQFREVVLYAAMPDARSIIFGWGVAFACLFVGTFVFQKTQNKFILYI